MAAKKAAKKKAAKKQRRATPKAPMIHYLVYDHEGEFAGDYETPEEAILDAWGPRFRDKKSMPSFSIVPFVNATKLQKLMNKSGSPGLTGFDVLNDAHVKIEEAFKCWKRGELGMNKEDDVIVTRPGESLVDKVRSARQR